MKTAILISGGVDSAVVVHKLAEEGDDIHLFYIRIGMDNDEGDCSAEEDIEMCTLIARRYGLPFDVVSLHQEYWDHVMAYTLDTVKRGLTPHPDMMCNKMIKFGFFEERWGKEFDRTATGHYARSLTLAGRHYLGTAVDPVKDQTDFLAQISYQQLSHIVFPLGDMPKSEVRETAQRVHLPNAGRKDSQGICFLGKINYSDFIKRHLGERPGAIIEIETGRKIGMHKGVWFHTIGQRKGLGLSGGPWFVVKKNVHDNAIYVSRGYATPLQYGRAFNMEEFNWISGNPFSDTLPGIDLHSTGEQLNIAFKTRHTPDFAEGTLHANSDGSFSLEADTDIQGIAPGQFGIIYTSDKRICLGSGMISTPYSDKK